MNETNSLIYFVLFFLLLLLFNVFSKKPKPKEPVRQSPPPLPLKILKTDVVKKERKNPVQKKPQVKKAQMEKRQIKILSEDNIKQAFILSEILKRPY